MKKDQIFINRKVRGYFIFHNIMNTARCVSECKRGDLPSKQICRDFFKKVGGKKHFLDEHINGAKINMYGRSHECSIKEGPGEYGWCWVRYVSRICSTNNLFFLCR